MVKIKCSTKYNPIHMGTVGVERVLLHCSSLSNSQRTNYRTTLPGQEVFPQLPLDKTYTEFKGGGQHHLRRKRGVTNYKYTQT